MYFVVDSFGVSIFKIVVTFLLPHEEHFLVEDPFFVNVAFTIVAEPYL